jgi:hypothetical protein
VGSSAAGPSLRVLSRSFIPHAAHGSPAGYQVCVSPTYSCKEQEEDAFQSTPCDRRARGFIQQARDKSARAAGDITLGRMRTDRDALRVAGAVLFRGAAVGTLFAAAAHFLKHSPPAVILLAFLVPTVVTLVLAVAVLQTPKPKERE